MSDDVYRERAHLVAFLASVFPSVIAYSDPNEPDWPVVYVNAPLAGQMSWHIHKDDLPLFLHVPRVAPDDPRAKWDGHTTHEKYLRLSALTDRPTINIEVKSQVIDDAELLRVWERIRKDL